MALPLAPYAGNSTLALVARASAFTAGVAYGRIKLKYLRSKAKSHQKAEAKAPAKAEAKAPASAPH